MAWWDNLAKIGGVVAAPFTGGASLWPALALGAGGAAAGYGLSKLGGNGDDSNPEDAITGQLQDSSTAMRSTGSGLLQGGEGTINPLVQYFQNLFSNNPAAVMDATRGERGRVIDQFDTARRAATEFGPRGGGLTSALAESRLAEGEKLAAIPGEAQAEARNTAAALGMGQVNAGLSANALASQDLDTIIRTILAREGLDVEKRGQNMQLWSAIGEAAGTIAASAGGG